MRLLKLSIVPAVLLFSVVMAAPASAHVVNNVTISVGCGTGNQAGQVCVHLVGDIQQDTDERFVFVDVFASNDLKTSLGEKVFDIPAFDTTDPKKNHFDKTICFDAITNSNATSFTVQIMRVTSDAAGKILADLQIDLASGPVNFDKNHQPVTPVGDTNKCVAPTPPSSPSPSASASAATTSTTLAGTGGFDFRFPLIGLTVLVAGLALLLVSASRGRSTTK